MVYTVTVQSEELVINGDFSNGSTGWTLGAGWTIENGTAAYIGDGSFQPIVTSATIRNGFTYEIKFNLI